MKKIYLTLVLACSLAGARAQSQIIDGNLSIGIDGSTVVGAGNRIYFNGTSFNGDELSMYRFNRAANISDLRVNIGDDYGSGDDRFVLGTTNWVDGKYYIHMVVGADGKVGIGTESFGTERLAVNGNIRAREVKVEATGWPDYVFEEGYKVGTLEGLESYIKANKHLPEVPSAKEVATNGIELGEMNKLLLKKVEELTLHLIEKDKNAVQQAKQLKSQAELLAVFEERLKKLENINATKK
ncbi:hypothetical protein [Pedobacter kyungheensis]|uniref:hypothetical protein n=1 Tax=Pedobacter kyungheensis TaxID=1069985 RepID=UPI00068B1899|nr:hypothetical protein [Pedobacter kyungheensis]